MTSLQTTTITKPPRSRADRNIAWIEKHCYIPEGQYVGQRVKLRDWQREEIRKIYDNPHGTRRAIISFGRKNAKTTFAAFLLLLHLCGPEARRNSQLYSSGQSREQAGIIFNLAAKIVRMSPALLSYVQIRETAKQLLCPTIGTHYRALSAEATTAFGLSPVFIVHDELGQVQGPKSMMYEALETATGAQKDPLSIIISTQAPTDLDLLSVLIDDALEENDPRVVVSLYTVPIEVEDIASDDTIRMANPAFGDFLNPDEVRAMARDAQRMPSREPEYRNLILNQRVEATTPFVSKSLWKSCNTEVIKSFKGLKVYAGLDLAETQDLTALVLIAQVGKIWHIKPTFWLPEDVIDDRSRIDRVPYNIWHKEGFLETTPGKSVEYEWVAAYLKEVFSKMNVEKLAFDRWGFKHLKPWLQAKGFSDYTINEKFAEFGQGYESMTPALRALESQLLQGFVAHGDHPVLGMCAANAVVQTDPAGNRKLTKAKSHGRIDGLVAMTMAFGVALHIPKPEYRMVVV